MKEGRHNWLATPNQEGTVTVFRCLDCGKQFAFTDIEMALANTPYEVVRETLLRENGNCDNKLISKEATK